MKKILALSLSLALILSSTPSFAFHRKPKAKVVYAPEHILVVHRPDNT